MERIGVGFSGGMSPQDIVECVKVAEELGYESAWVAEGHGGDQFSVLTACAMVTERIKLGTSITSVFVRTWASAAATKSRWNPSTGWSSPARCNGCVSVWTSSGPSSKTRT